MATRRLGRVAGHLLAPEPSSDTGEPAVSPTEWTAADWRAAGQRKARSPLLDTAAIDVASLQEHKLNTPDALSQAQSWARQRGWKLAIASALVGPGGGRSAGVAVAAAAEQRRNDPC